MTYIPNTRDNCLGSKNRRNFSSGNHTNLVELSGGIRGMIIGLRPESDTQLIDLHSISIYSDSPILWEIYYCPSVVDAIWKDVGSASITTVGRCTKLYNLCLSGYLGSSGQHTLHLGLRDSFTDPLRYQHDTIVVMATTITESSAISRASCMISWTQSSASHSLHNCTDHD